MDEQTNTHSSKPRILVVDEDFQAAETIRETLVSKGFHVEIAGNRQQAFNFLRGPQQFDLLITSSEMPEMESLEFLRMTRQLREGPPVMMF